VLNSNESEERVSAGVKK